MDIWLWIISTILILFGLFGVPLPYGKMGKKIKKGYKWSRGLAKIVYDRFFVNGRVVESFVYFIEEFENFESIGYTPSFLGMYRELLGKIEFSKLENDHIANETERIHKRYLEITRIQNLNRKTVFKQTVKDFKKLVEGTSKMARSIKETIRTKNISQTILGQDFFDRYKFSANEFNNFLRYFRSYLDKTNCSHDVEIEQNRLRQLLVPEELF